MKSHVILCAHNGERFIAEQIKSIVDQARSVNYIHVFDFGSRDGTVDLIKRLQVETGQDVIHLTCYNDAPGASLSFFRAFTAFLPLLAEDDYVYLCDQDDIWQPQKTSVIAPLIEARIASNHNQALLLFHDVIVVDAALRTIISTFYTGKPFRLPRDLYPDRLLLANPAIGHTMVMSRSLLALVSEWATKDSYLMHDWCLVLFASRCGTVQFVPEALSLYRQHDANVLGAHRSRTFADRVHRTRGFATRVTRQARMFALDLARLRAAGAASLEPRDLVADRWLATRPLVNRLQLAAMALTRGPTMPRRALALFILAGRSRT